MINHEKLRIRIDHIKKFYNIVVCVQNIFSVDHSQLFSINAVTVGWRFAYALIYKVFTNKNNKDFVPQVEIVNGIKGKVKQYSAKKKAKNVQGGEQRKVIWYATKYNI